MYSNIYKERRIKESPKVEHILFTKSQGVKILISDYLIFTMIDRIMCNKFKSLMVLDLHMSNLGKMKHFLEIEVRHFKWNFHLQDMHV